MTAHRLTRCRHDRKIAGVAAGMAEYLDLDPTVVRVAWILATFIGGFTIPLYVILWFVMPLEPEAGVAPAPMAAAAAAPEASPIGPEGETVADTIGTAARSLADSASTVAAEIGHRHRSAGGESRLGLVLGVLLVVFGGIALIGPMLPGWVGSLHLGPAFILALGIALLVSATRRSPANG